MEMGVAALKKNDKRMARPFLYRSVLIVRELANGLDFRYGELPINKLRLYEFVIRCLDSVTIDKIESALGVMRRLREALHGIRAEAVELERSGEIPPVGATHRLQMLA
jgi:flagellin-specific chaperone FliS